MLESCAASKRIVRGKYNGYTPEQRAEIGKYTKENGATNVAKCYTTAWGLALMNQQQGGFLLSLVWPDSLHTDTY